MLYIPGKEESRKGESEGEARCDEMSKMANGRKSTNKEAKANKQIQNKMSKGARRGEKRGGVGRRLT